MKEGGFGDRASGPVPNNLPAKRRDVIGRDREIASLEEAIRADRRVALVPTAPAPLGGFGASAVALAFARRALIARAYPGGVFWLHASGTPSEALARLGPDLAVIGAPITRERLAEEPADAPPDDAARAVKQALQDQREPSLLVLDEVDHEGFADRIPLGEVRVILVPNEPRFALRKRLAIPPLPAAACADLARDLGARPQDASDRLALEALTSKDLSGSPLAVTLAARAVAHADRSWITYGKRLRARSRALLGEGSAPDGYASTLVAAIDVAIETHGRASAPRRLLEAASVFAPHAAPIAWALAAAGLDAASADEAITPLVDLGLLDVDPIAQTISMHRFVHRRARDLARPDAERTASRRAAAGVAVWLTEGPSRGAEIDARRPHIDAALEAAERAGAGHAWVIIADRVGVDLERRARFDEARTLLENALKKAEVLDPPDPGQVRVCLSNLAGLLVEVGESNKARALLERALAVNDDLDSDAPSSVRLSKLSRALHDVGHVEAARPLLERALAPSIEAAPAPPAASPRLPDAARVLHELKHAHGDSIDRALAGVTDAPDVATILRAVEQSAAAPATSDGAPTAAELTTLGLSLYALGHPGDARPLLERALASDLAAHGPDHPEVAADLLNLSAVLATLGEREKARSYLTQAKAIAEAALPEGDALRRGIEARLARV